MIGDEEPFDVLVVGAGPAGLGVGVALKPAGITNFQILDRGLPGKSFMNWPPGMQLITPSFPSNSIGMLDLNAIAIGTSPGYSLGTEHPLGKDFAVHLMGLSQVFELPTRSNREVVDVYKDSDEFFVVMTIAGELRCRHLIWATGEFQFPNIPTWLGASHGVHNSRIGDWAEYVANGKGPVVITGGYESGVDAAHQPSKHDCKSILLARENTWESEDSEPSRSLSPFTLQRFLTARSKGMLEPIGGVDVQSIEKIKNGFTVTAADERMNWALHPLLRPLGLSGRDAVRVMMGFGCNVPAVISTRACSGCSRGKAMSAIAFGAACSYQLPATLAVLAVGATASGHSAGWLTFLFLSYLFLTTVLYLRFTAPKEARNSLNVLMTPHRSFMQCPSLSAVLREFSSTLRQFFWQAMPIFLLICIVASLLSRMGELDAMSQVLGPVMSLFNLPLESALAIVLSSIRKDGIFLFAAKEGLAWPMTALQMLTAVHLASVLLPCLVTATTIARESSWKTTGAMLARQAAFAQFFSFILAWGGRWVL